MDIEGLRADFVKYCSLDSSVDSQKDVIQRLCDIQLQLARCHSAYECAKSFPEIGPLLNTLARSRITAQDTQLSQVVISTAMEYSKIFCQGTYSNQRAWIWFSQLVSTIFKNTDQLREVYQAGELSIETSKVDAHKFILRQLVRLVAQDTQPTDQIRQREMWEQVFSICCCDDQDIPELVGELVPGMDTVAWDVLENHQLLTVYGMRIISNTALAASTKIWEHSSKIRAQLVLQLLPAKNSADLKTQRGINELLKGIFSSGTLTAQLVRDMSALIRISRDARPVNIWRSVCGEHISLIKFSDEKVFGNQSGEQLYRLFGNASTDSVHIHIREQWECIAYAKQALSFSDLLALWLGIVAVSEDSIAFDVIGSRFGPKALELGNIDSKSDSSILQADLQQKCEPARFVIEREMALDVASFLWAPLDQPAVAKSSVLAEWMERQQQTKSQKSG